MIPARILARFALTAAMLSTGACRTTASRTDAPVARLVPPGWRPSLEQVQDDLEDSVRASRNQQTMNKGSQNFADVADARLFIAYVLLMDQLDGAGRAQLLGEQRQWLQQRAEAAKAAVQSQGGSLAPAERAAAISDITKRRLAELESRLGPRQ